MNVGILCGLELLSVRHVRKVEGTWMELAARLLHEIETARIIVNVRVSS